MSRFTNMESSGIFWFRFLAAASLLVLGATFRLMPHPPNFSPVIAMALFGGAVFPDRQSGILLSLATLLFTDWVLGFHDQMLAVYGATALIALFGQVLRNDRSARKTASAAILSSALFYLITNFSVWNTGMIYPRNFQGLLNCFILALPFAQRSLIGDLVFTGVLFGGWALVEKGIPQIKYSRTGS